MIINNLGQTTIQPTAPTNLCNANSETRDIAFKVTSSDGQQISGTVDNQNYREVSPPGKPPYTVHMGFLNGSYSNTVEGVTSTDTVFSGLMIYPTGTGLDGNGYRIIVTESA